MADATKVIERLQQMLGSAQRELAIALVELDETQEKLLRLQVDKEEDA